MPRRIRSWLAWLLPALLLFLAPPAMADAPRLALVIGNAAYPARPLATPANDAALVAQALAQAGFDVSAARDLDAAALRATLAAFVEAARTAGPDATLFVYLAGYGVQYDGGNYFVPIDARLVHDDDVPGETASLESFVEAIAAVPAKARLVVADADRAQPFATADEMPLAPGLGLTTAPRDTIVAFAGAPDTVAPDDTVPYGAYARALAEAIAAPGLSPNTLFDRVRLRVGMLTNGEQVPWDDGVVADGVSLTPAVAAAPAVTPGPQPPGGALSADTAYSVVVARDTLGSYAEFLRVVPDGPLATRVHLLQAMRREAAMWEAAAAADDPRAAWTYMRRYPRAPHRFDARRRLAGLHAALEPPTRFEPYTFLALPPPTPAELPLVAAPAQALRDLPPIPPPPADLLPQADPAYYDDLPMPMPAPAGLLPIAPPLPGTAGGASGQISQVRPGPVPVVSQTRLAPDGSASITLADAAGPVAELVANDAGGATRTLIETGLAPLGSAKTGTNPGKPAASQTTRPPIEPPRGKVGPQILARTSVGRTAEGVTITQADGAGTGLLEITTRADADGVTTTRVTNDRDETLAGWRRNAQGVVFTREIVSPSDKTASVAVDPPSDDTRGQPSGRPPSQPPTMPQAPMPQAKTPQAKTPTIAPSIPVRAAAPPRTSAPLPPRPEPVPHETAPREQVEPTPSSTAKLPQAPLPNPPPAVATPTPAAPTPHPLPPAVRAPAVPVPPPRPAAKAPKAPPPPHRKPPRAKSAAATQRTPASKKTGAPRHGRRR